MEEEDDEKIEEMIDDISTNEMFGSSILSNGDGDNWSWENLLNVNNIIKHFKKSFFFSTIL